MGGSSILLPAFPVHIRTWIEWPFRKEPLMKNACVEAVHTLADPGPSPRTREFYSDRALCSSGHPGYGE
ncbi:MAG: hypothetical protein M1297_05840 [Nitrospirae bacterium]|nr:hypothetical protein [Nitrospirota bacterium]